MAVGFIGRGNRRTRRKPPICRKSNVVATFDPCFQAYCMLLILLNLFSSVINIKQSFNHIVVLLQCQNVPNNCQIFKCVLFPIFIILLFSHTDHFTRNRNHESFLCKIVYSVEEQTRKNSNFPVHGIFKNPREIIVNIFR